MSNDNLEDLIKNYINNDKKVGESILNKFSPFINQFANVLYYGEYSLDNSTVKNFMNFLSRDNKKARNIIGVINKMYSSYEYEDVIQDLYYLFLKMTKNFDIDKIQIEDYEKAFLYYIKDNYKYYIKKEIIDEFLNSPITMYGDDCGQVFVESNTVEDNFLDNQDNWIKGLTTTKGAFKNLNDDERELLIKYYVEDYNLKDLEKEMDVTYTAIHRRINKIKDKLVKEI